MYTRIILCAMCPGSGQEWGGLEVQLHNRYHQPLQVVYMDMIPWFLRLYTHTMKIVVTGQNNTLQEVPNSSECGWLHVCICLCAVP